MVGNNALINEVTLCKFTDKGKLSYRLPEFSLKLVFLVVFFIPLTMQTLVLCPVGTFPAGNPVVPQLSSFTTAGAQTKTPVTTRP